MITGDLPLDTAEVSFVTSMEMINDLDIVTGYWGMTRDDLINESLRVHVKMYLDATPARAGGEKGRRKRRNK